jgi:hypothetical protein
MTSRPLVAALVIGAVFSASIGGRAFAQARPPMIPPPAAAPAPAPPPAAAPAQVAPAGQYPPGGQYPTYPQYGQPGQYQQYPAPQPPASAIAPNGEYVAPLSQTTQPTYVPQSVALSGPRFIKDWEEGQPIPYGYHHETRARKGLVIAGSIVFGVVYIYSSLIAAAGEDSYNNNDNQLAALWIPVLGPFIQMASVDSSIGKEMLFLDGLAQAAGLTMLITGLVYPRHILVRNDLASMSFVPMKLGTDGSGLGVVGRF